MKSTDITAQYTKNRVPPLTYQSYGVRLTDSQWEDLTKVNVLCYKLRRFVDDVDDSFPQIRPVLWTKYAVQYIEQNDYDLYCRLSMIAMMLYMYSDNKAIEKLLKQFKIGIRVQ